MKNLSRSERDALIQSLNHTWNDCVWWADITELERRRLRKNIERAQYKLGIPVSEPIKLDEREAA